MLMRMGSKSWIREKKVERLGFIDYIILIGKGKKKRINNDLKFG